VQRANAQRGVEPADKAFGASACLGERKNISRQNCAGVEGDQRQVGFDAGGAFREIRQHVLVTVEIGCDHCCGPQPRNGIHGVRPADIHQWKRLDLRDRARKRVAFPI